MATGIPGGFTRTDAYLFQLSQTPDGQRLLRLAFPQQFGGGVGNIPLLQNPFITGTSTGLVSGLATQQVNAKLAQFDAKYGNLLGAGLTMSPEASLLYQTANTGIAQQAYFGQSAIGSGLGALGILDAAGGRFAVNGELGGLGGVGGLNGFAPGGFGGFPPGVGGIAPPGGLGGLPPGIGGLNVGGGAGLGGGFNLQSMMAQLLQMFTALMSSLGGGAR